MKNEQIKESISKAIEQLIAALNEGRSETVTANLRASRWSTPRISPQSARGTSHSGKITLLPGQAPAEEFATLVHELAHEMLHCHERRESATKRVPETEAEAVSFVVCNAIGLDTGTAAQDSIHLYQGYAKLLTESLDCIQQAANRILTAITPGSPAPPA